jgi:hypothetical protein
MRGVLLFLCLSACGGGPKIYGASASEQDLEHLAVDLDKGLQSPLNEVVVRGEIGQVCDQGCWFYLLGQKGMVYVKLDLGRGLVIPVDSKGKKAVVAGKFEGEGEARKLVGETVLLY